jgi:hypothetical protein
VYELKQWAGKFSKKLHPKNIILNLELNWIGLLILSSFYVYGYFGYGSVGISKNNLYIRLITILYILTLSLIFFKKNLNLSYFSDRILITGKDLYISFLFFFCVLAISTPYLNEYLTQDELSYAGSALENPLKILKMFIYIPWHFQVNNLLHLVSFLILIGNLVFIRMFLKFKVKIQIIIIALLTIFFQLIYGFFGVNHIGYSKLNTLPYTITAAVFGVNPLIFRTTTILIISIVLSLTCKFLANSLKIPRVYWIIVSCIFITAPIELAYSFTVDQSIFFYIFAIIPLIEIFFRQSPRPERCIPLLVVGVYFRISVILILILYIFYILKLFNFKIGTLKPFFLPLTFLLPYIYGLIVSPIASKNSNLFEGLSNLPNSIFISLKISFGFLYMFFSIICLLLISYYKKNNFLIIVAYLILVILFFYISIPTNLVGTQKYQQEWFSPLFFMCLVFAALVFHKFRNLLPKFIFALMTFSLVFYNLQVFMSLPQKNSFLLNFPYQSSDYLKENSKNSFAISFHPYPYLSAFNYLSKDSDNNRCFNGGVVYNLLPEIFSGINIREFKFLENQRSNFLSIQSVNGHDWTSVSSGDLELSKISCVVLGSVTDKPKVIEDLLLHGWKVQRVFYHNRFPTNVMVLVRT